MHKFIKKIKRRNIVRFNAFTVIEMVIVLGIISIVIAMVVPRVLVQEGSIAGNVIAADNAAIANLIAEAQNNAASNKLNEHWGIHVVDDSSTDCGVTYIADCLVLYKGSTYAGRDETYDQIVRLNASISWGNNTDTDFYFNRGTGLAQGLDGTATSTLYLRGSTASSTIGITSAGAVTTRNDWYGGDWIFRKPITINGNQVAGTLANFPILASTTDADLLANAQADGDDILFTMGDGQTKLAHEIEKYDSNTGGLVAWVNVESISQASSTIYMYYGNDTAIDQSNVTAVWDSGYAAVWHMNNTASSTNSITDSTSNGNHGTPLSPVPSAGAVGNALYFDGIDDIITITEDDSLDQTTAITLEYWVHMTDDVSQAEGVYNKNGSWRLDISGTGLRTRFTISGDGTIQGNNQTIDIPRHHVTTFDSGLGKVYYDGSLLNPPFSDTLNVTTANLKNSNAYIGAFSDTSKVNSLDGWLDEIRISSIARSAIWIQTSYNTQSSTLPFLTWGTEEDLW